MNIKKEELKVNLLHEQEKGKEKINKALFSKLLLSSYNRVEENFPSAINIRV